MKDTEFFQWWQPPPPSKPKGKPTLTRYKMTREEAAQRMPGAEPHLPSREVRALPESDQEMTAAMQGQHVSPGGGRGQKPAREEPVDKSGAGEV